VSVRYVAGRDVVERLEASMLREIATVSHPLAEGDRFSVALTEERCSGRRYCEMHQGFELSVVLSGGLERYYEDYTLEQIPGDVHLSCPWEAHGWRTTSPRRSNLLIQFRAEFLGDEEFDGLPWLVLYAVRPQHRPRVSDAQTRARAVAVAEELIEAAGRARRAKRQFPRDRGSGRAGFQTIRLGGPPGRMPPAWESVVRLAVLRVLVLLYQHWPYRDEIALMPGGRGNGLTRILPAIELTSTPPERTRRVTVAQAAAACKLSATQFRVLFHRAMGVSFGRFELRKRLARASYLLVTTDLPIDALADQCGFADRSHLHRMFTRLHGATPGAHRARARAAS